MNATMTFHEGVSEMIMNRFAIFCVLNTDIPFIFKREVLEAAVNRVMLHSSEISLTARLKA